uniref:Uncharacterized protein n=1 Tax=Romanomermis culicivorax TaxID=13658 RepID=A0A915HZW9_ROMCU
MGDAKAVTLVPNVRAGVTIPTRAQQKYPFISYPTGRMLNVLDKYKAFLDKKAMP